MTKEIDFAKELIDFIYDSPTAFHATYNVAGILSAAGFEEINDDEEWNLIKGGKYFIIKNNSAITAFTVGSENIEETGFRIIGAHTDAPTFRIKPNPEIIGESNYLKLNTEVYGGPILNTWMDRPLSIAGRVVIKGKDVFKPTIKLVNINKPIIIIPNLSIHMNRDVNKGIELNRQVDMLPIITMINENFEKKNYLLNLISEELNVACEEILDFDLFLYEFEKGCVMGANNEFISSSRLDDLSMVHAGVNALVNANNGKAINVMTCFDNEEVGSATKQGADSEMLSNILERISISFSKNRQDYFRSLSKSFIISADSAHAVHPNRTEKADLTNRPIINKGPVIKIAASQSYTSDSVSIAIYESICKNAGVPIQKFVNRSDERGGSTIGPISSTHLNINSVDMGTPLLAMHSVRELGGVYDHYFASKSFQQYYES